MKKSHLVGLLNRDVAMVIETLYRAHPPMIACGSWFRIIPGVAAHSSPSTHPLIVPTGTFITPCLGDNLDVNTHIHTHAQDGNFMLKCTGEQEVDSSKRGLVTAHSWLLFSLLLTAHRTPHSGNKHSCDQITLSPSYTSLPGHGYNL